MKNSKLIKAFVCLVLVALIGLLPMSAMATSKAYILVVTNEGARLRDSAGSSSNVLRSLSAGTKLLYCGNAEGYMCKVVTADGVIGYVYRDFLALYGAVRKDQVYMTNTTTPVYKRSGNSFKEFTTIGSGKFVLVMGVSDTIAFVRAINGYGGYIPCAALTRVF